jgi:hypothetical protein
MLAISATLKKLSLWENVSGTQRARALAAALVENAALTELHLDLDLYVGLAGARLLPALATNTALIHLDLGISQIGSEGARSLAAALGENAALTKLNLCLGKLIVHAAAEALATVLAFNTTLNKLCTSPTAISAMWRIGARSGPRRERHTDGAAPGLQ